MQKPQSPACSSACMPAPPGHAHMLPMHGQRHCCAQCIVHDWLLHGQPRSRPACRLGSRRWRAGSLHRPGGQQGIIIPFPLPVAFISDDEPAAPRPGQALHAQQEQQRQQQQQRGTQDEDRLEADAVSSFRKGAALTSDEEASPTAGGQERQRRSMRVLAAAEHAVADADAAAESGSGVEVRHVWHAHGGGGAAPTREAGRGVGRLSQGGCGWSFVMCTRVHTVYTCDI